MLSAVFLLSFLLLYDNSYILKDDRLSDVFIQIS